ncbi:MAG: hypothetical protein NTW11_01160 [Candidatus Staskawiczbacteria bacterium]|nr:hypothetical protein [Candidatus Staskawiczbacteria bacterium]
MQSSERKNIISLWLVWHFGEMPRFLAGVWKNYILFASNYFSLPILLKSLFAPWRRYRWNYPKGFQIGEFFTTLVSNIFSRLMGAMVRIVLIICGIVFQIFVILAGAVVFIFWILLPLIIIIGLWFVFFY